MQEQDSSRQAWLEAQANFYRTRLDEKDEVFSSAPYARRIQQEWLGFVERYLHAGASVLDVGCADGWQARWLAGKGAGRVVAIDLTPAFIMKARSLTPPDLEGRVTYVCCPIEDYRSEEAFDLVVMRDVFEHLWKPAAAMYTIASLITERSIVLIQTPNRRRLRNVFWRLVGKSAISPAHRQEYTPGEFESLLQLSRYSIEHRVGLGFFPGLGRLQGQHDRLFALDLALGARLPGLAGGIMAACRREMAA
jgi:2-polyprenyl-3-methyl-5-hydroxy-6-metoxy-1,4-benzoquinol methylase